MKEGGFVFDPRMQSRMLSFYCDNNNLEDAKTLHNEITNQLDFKLDDLKILAYAHLLLSNGLQEGNNLVVL